MSFEKLLEEMEVLAKAQAVPKESIGANKDNKRIQDAAVDGENNDTQTDADNGTGAGAGVGRTGTDNSSIVDDPDSGGRKSGKPISKPMSKSFILTMQDGSEMEAFDGSELVKSLTERLEVTESELAAEKEANLVTQDKVMKSFAAAVGLLSKQAESIKEQGLMIKSLNDKIVALGKEGRGARSVRAATDITAQQLNKSLNANAGVMSNQEILAKSLVALKSGRISGMDATRIETSLNMGIAVPADLLSTISHQ